MHVFLYTHSTVYMRGMHAAHGDHVTTLTVHAAAIYSMGKPKSLTAKRRQRRRQKQSKRTRARKVFEYEELESESHNDVDFGGRVASATEPLSSNKTFSESLREDIGTPSFSSTNLSIGQDKNVQSDLIRIHAAEQWGIGR